jgi:hypothetical protein
MSIPAMFVELARLLKLMRQMCGNRRSRRSNSALSLSPIPLVH